MKTFSNAWAKVHFEQWRKNLKQFISVSGVRALEIGSFEGQSASWFLDTILTGPGSTLTCLDMWEDPAREATFDANTSEYGERLRKVKSKSLLHLAGLVARGKREIFDFIYVDGGHDGIQTLEDAVLSWVLLKRDGIMMFDDCSIAYMEKNSYRQIVPRVTVNAFLRTRHNHERLEDDRQIVIRKT